VRADRVGLGAWASAARWCSLTAEWKPYLAPDSSE
jgi:hypothetical protein